MLACIVHLNLHLKSLIVFPAISYVSKANILDLTLIPLLCFIILSYFQCLIIVCYMSISLIYLPYTPGPETFYLPQHILHSPHAILVLIINSGVAELVLIVNYL